jgi:hypothetical protein
MKTSFAALFFSLLAAAAAVPSHAANGQVRDREREMMYLVYDVL